MPAGDISCDVTDAAVSRREVQLPGLDALLQPRFLPVRQLPPATGSGQVRSGQVGGIRSGGRNQVRWAESGQVGGIRSGQTAEAG